MARFRWNGCKASHVQHSERLSTNERRVWVACGLRVHGLLGDLAADTLPRCRKAAESPICLMLQSELRTEIVSIAALKWRSVRPSIDGCERFLINISCL